MGRKGTGVEIRAKSIRVSFMHEGALVKRTLIVNGRPMAPTPTNLKHAERMVVSIREKIRHDAFSMAEFFPADGAAYGGSLGEQLDSWLKAQRIKKSTRRGYKTAIRFWKSAEVDGRPLGNRMLRTVRTSHLLTALAAKECMSGKTVNNYVSVIREALDLAVIDKLLIENPASSLKRAAYQKEPADPFTQEEAEQIIAAAHKKYPGQVGNMVEAWFWTGLRTSELFALRWPNVLLATGRITISEAFVQGHLEASTKTSVEREVVLNSRALAAIQSQRALTQLAGKTVFHDPKTGERWKNEQNFRRAYWIPLLHGLGIRYRRAYNCRHTYATKMLMAGMAPAFCARQLGHSVQVFLTTYAKWLDGVQNDAEMQRLESGIRAAAKEKSGE